LSPVSVKLPSSPKGKLPSAPEQDHIGHWVSMRPPGGLTIRISKSNVAEKFKNLLKKRYPDGITKDDAKIWREPIKIIPQIERVRSLDNKNVKRPAMTSSSGSRTRTRFGWTTRPSRYNTLSKAG